MIKKYYNATLFYFSHYNYHSETAYFDRLIRTKHMKNYIYIVLTFAILFTISCATTPAPRQTVNSRGNHKAETVKRVEETPESVVRNILKSNFEKEYSNSHIVIGDTRVKTSNYLKSLYLRNDYKPLWFDKNGMHKTAFNIPDIIDGTYHQGLDPDDYNPELVKKILKDFKDFNGIEKDTDFKSVCAADLVLSNTVLKISSDIYYGGNDVSNIYKDGIEPNDSFDFVGYIKKKIDDNDLNSIVDHLTPESPIYNALLKHLEQYREIRSKGGWPSIPHVYSKLEKGNSDPRVLVIKKRLLVTGDFGGGRLSENSSYMNDEYFDDTLYKAVLNFQKRHGLKEDGVIGQNTLKALNETVEKKIEILKLNLDLWRRLPRDLGDRYVIVNIPAFHLYGFQRNHNDLEMKVVVGKSDWNTPIFHDKMTYVVINPYWNVPSSIFRDEILPELKKDPNYLNKQNISIITGWQDDAIPLDPLLIDWSNFDPDKWNIRLRQNPGPDNPLGRLKFMFPNKYNVYLHDTPVKSLFNRLNRNYSHGCIRVEKPLDLAEFVFDGNNSWNRDRIIKEINTGVSKQVSLPSPVPVYVLYFTAWVENDGQVYFYEDIYHLTGL